MPERCIDSPLGKLTITCSSSGITDIAWREGGLDDSPILWQAETEILQYFAGQRRAFTLPLRLTHTSDTQQMTCAAIAAIPFGETRSYGDLAKQLGLPAQAIGQGCGANPIPILIPCHRVTGTTGLGGFSGGTGVETKTWLLRHEGALLI